MTITARLRIAALLAAAFLASAVLSACGGGGGGSTRTIEVDYQNDEFAGAYLGYYPRHVTVAPGMTLKFHQTWSGEPHSVTLGSLVDTKVAPLLSELDAVLAGKVSPPPPEFLTQANAFASSLPRLVTNAAHLDQRAAQPCFLDQGEDLPLSDQPCAKAQQEQKPFNGTEAYYSSGFIPYEGVRGNTFEMKIATNAKDGTYFYYCNVHGIYMSGEITVKDSAKVESQTTINRQGKAEADRVAKPLLAVHKREEAGNGQFPGNLAGSGDATTTHKVPAIINEFTPKTIETSVGTPVTWTFIGTHTISFNVPAYSPIFTFGSDGDLAFNGDLNAPKVWPGVPDRSEGPRPPVDVDAGSWDGSGGLHSSGTGWRDGDTYTITFTKKRTYPYRCLIHPGMIGKVVVK